MATLADRGILLRPFPVVPRMAHPGNFGARGNTPVDLVVVHTTEARRGPAALVAGAPPSAVAWFADPKAKASAHYVVGCDGGIWQTVAEGDCAWHAGNSAVNRRSIGIEVEGFSLEAATWNPEAWSALVMLCADVCRRHAIPVLHQPGPGLCGHSDVPDPEHPDLRGGLHHHRDPGPHLNWQHLLDALRAELTGDVA